jgi:hypothetical protein
MIIRIVDHVLADEDTGLDRLPEPDFVRKKVSLDWILKHTPDDLNLVRLKLDSG